MMKQSELWQKTSGHTQRRAEWNLIRKLFTKVWAGLEEPVRDGEVCWGGGYHDLYAWRGMWKVDFLCWLTD